MNVVVASAPSSVVVGDYTCMNIKKATKQVESLELIAVVGDSAPRLPQCSHNKKFVTLQEPGPGEEVSPGSMVTLYTGEK